MTEYRKDTLKEVKIDSRKIGVMLLESITQGLYKDPRNAIREYIQNEFDAGAKQIKIETYADMVTITGDSLGMTDHEFNMATAIGISHKESSSNVGFRGIGIWSGVSICEEIAIFTKRKGEKVGKVIVIDAAGITQDMENPTMPLTKSLSNRVFTTTSSAPDPSLWGTRVELRGIHQQFRSYLKRNSLKNYLRQIAPLPLNPNFGYSKEIEKALSKNVSNYRTVEILLDGVQLYRPPQEAEELESPKMDFIKIETNGKENMAYYWYCIGGGILTEKEARIPVYKLMSFTVGDEHRKTLSELDIPDPTPIRWVTGEIHILDPRLRPNSERSDLEPGEGYDLFMEQVIKMLIKAIKDARRKSYTQSAERKLETAKDFIEIQSTKREEIVEGIAEGKRLAQLLGRDIKSGIFPRGSKKDARKTMKALDTKVEDLVSLLAGEVEELEVEEIKEEEKEKPKKKKRKKRKRRAPSAEKLVESLKGLWIFSSKELIFLDMIYEALEKILDTKQIRRFELALRKIIAEGPEK